MKERGARGARTQNVKRPSIHVQGWLDPQNVATVAMWMLEQGKELRSMAELLARAMEVLADAVVAEGHRPIMEQEEILEVLSYIGSNRSVKSKPLRLAAMPPGGAATSGILDPAVMREALAIHASGKYTSGVRGTAALPPEGIEVIESIADDGEFSAKALRTMAAEPPEENEHDTQDV